MLVSGELKPGDEKTFINQSLGLDRAVVVFNSSGGNLVAGLEIGRAIRLKSFDTVVVDGQICASACAFAWLGGRTRYMATNASIAFHAAYEFRDGVPGFFPPIKRRP